MLRGQWWLAHCASWSVPIYFSALLEKSVLLTGWDPVRCAVEDPTLWVIWLSGRAFSFWLFGHRCVFRSDFRSWPSSTPLWSRTTRPDGVLVRSQRSLKTCPTSLSAKETVWERFVFSHLHAHKNFYWKNPDVLRLFATVFLTLCVFSFQVADWTGATYQDKRYTSEWDNCPPWCASNVCVVIQIDWKV